MPWKTKPQRGLIRLASHLNGWYQMAMKMRAFRYATLKNLSRTYGTHPLTNTLPAIKMAGYPYQMPMASLPKLILF